MSQLKEYSEYKGINSQSERSIQYDEDTHYHYKIKTYKESRREGKQYTSDLCLIKKSAQAKFFLLLNTMTKMHKRRSLFTDFETNGTTVKVPLQCSLLILLSSKMLIFFPRKTLILEQVLLKKISNNTCYEIYLFFTERVPNMLQNSTLNFLPTLLNFPSNIVLKYPTHYFFFNNVVDDSGPQAHDCDSISL